MPYKPPDTILRALLMERFRVIEVIQTVILYSFQKATFDCGGRAGEVEKLVYFYTEGLPQLEGALNAILKRHQVVVTISGIFCHQTPKVISTAPVRQSHACELADIAFIAAYDKMVGWDRTGLGNALLVQCKEIYSPGSDVYQEYLYQQATAFEYVRTKQLNGQTRNLSFANNGLWVWEFKNWNQSAFLPIEHSSRGILSRPWTPTDIYAVPFAIALFDLMTGVAGRGIQKLAITDTENGWSRIIHDLVSVTAKATLRCKSAPITRSGTQLRGYGALSFLKQYWDIEPAMLFRCSLAEFLGHFHESYELKAVGKKLEELSKSEIADKFKSSGEPPSGNNILGQSKFDGDSEGGSFVVIRFSEVK